MHEFFKFLDICVMDDNDEMQFLTKGEIFLMVIVGIGLVVSSHL